MAMTEKQGGSDVRANSTVARPVGQGGPLAGVQLCQGHCPMQHVAAQFPQFCEAETEAFSRMLGVHVQRLATLAGGEHVCTTFIPTPSTPERTARPSQHTSDERFSR
jgi:predicted ArsR family transcriptional regulator